MSEDEDSKQAVALKYDGQNAPNVSATGEGELANQIIEIAREHGVPLFENPELMRLLSTLELGDEIPETLYLCIAQVIAFAYKIQGKIPEDWVPPEAKPQTPENEDFIDPYDDTPDQL